MNPEAKNAEPRGHINGDTPPEVLQIQYDICRRIPTGRKLELTFSMYDTGRLLALTGLQMLYPDAGEAQLQRLWALKHLGPELFEQVYGGRQHG